MELLAYLAAAVAYSTFAAYTSSYWAATQYWGLKLTYSRTTVNALLDNQQTSRYVKTIDINGLQSAITSSKQRYKLYIRYALNLVFFLVGAAFFQWYVPLSTLLGILFLKNTIRQFLPASNSEHYRNRIIEDLKQESVRYEKAMNTARKEDIDFFIKHLERLTVPSQLTSPSVRQHRQQNNQVSAQGVRLAAQNHSQLQ